MTAHLQVMLWKSADLLKQHIHVSTDLDGKIRTSSPHQFLLMVNLLYQSSLKFFQCLAQGIDCNTLIYSCHKQISLTLPNITVMVKWVVSILIRRNIQVQLPMKRRSTWDGVEEGNFEETDSSEDSEDDDKGGYDYEWQ